MANPYPDHGFATDQERWEEHEARFCEQMVESLLETVGTHASKLPQREKAPLYPRVVAMGAYISAHNAYECAIRAAVWQQMADNLRRPRIARIESPHEGQP
jgi:hypothetical protein